MKKLLLICGLMATQFMNVRAEVDPNFYIYICFGQSNMEGNAQPESVDKNSATVDSRFQLLATCNFSNPSRTLGKWYKAVPPLVSPNGGLGPTDYFGRTMVAALPANVKIGVIPVAMGGSPIEMFDKDKYEQKLNDNPTEWWATLAKNHYGGNPYGRIIDMAKKAQEVGVIKGILLHQGCSNNGDPNWPNMVKKIYNDMLTDLGLAADTVPLFVGETLRQENGGACYGHNTQVARMPSVVRTSHVVSSEGLPGNGQDPWHFNALGYRILGKRYAFEALKLMGVELKMDPDYTMNATLKKFYEVKSVKDFYTKVGDANKAVAVNAVYGDGHTETITKEVTPTYSEEVKVTSGKIGSKTGEMLGTGEVEYTDFTRKTETYTFNVGVLYFPFTAENITQQAGELTYDESKRSFKLSAGGQAGWTYSAYVDFSAYKYLVVKLKSKQSLGAEIRLSSSTSATSSACFKDTINDRTTIAIDLQNMYYGTAGSKVNPAKVRMVSFRSPKAGTLVVSDVFLSNDEEYAAATTAIKEIAIETPSSTAIYNLQGQKVGTRKDLNQLKRGIYVVNGKLIRNESR